MATPVQWLIPAPRKLYSGPLLERVAVRDCRTAESGLVA
ncbi:hypothetical protein FHX69_4012 [Prauserella muralis]|nr:hypothetical protein FHX69_4012 [Prauserella muralis]